jgi:hypothetical protein
MRKNTAFYSIQAVTSAKCRKYCLLVMVMISISFSIEAQTTRTSTTVGSLWFDGGTGWSAGVPDASDNVTFSNSAKATIQNAESASILALLFGNNAVLTINSGGTLTVNGSFTTNNGTALNIDGNLIINGDITVNNNLTWNINGSVTVNGNVNVNNNSTFDVNNSGTLNITGNFTGGTNTNFQVDGNVTIGGNLSVGNGSTATGSGTVNVGGSCTDGTSVFCNQGPLPVELTSFTALATGEGIIQLTWSTASQLDFSHFEVEHSMNAEDWDVLTTITGEGTTSYKKDYQFNHLFPGHGKNYYRLKMVDLDGTYEYSFVEVVSFALGKRISVSPNPTNGNSIAYHITFSPSEADVISIYDLTGSRLFSMRVMESSSDEILLPASVKPGAYVLRYDGSGFSESVRLLVH